MDKTKIKEKIGEKIDGLIEQGITSSNLDALDKLVDMMKDVHEIEKIEKEGGHMMYREGGYGNEYRNYPRREEYGNYGNDSYSRRDRDSRGRFTRRGNYRGEEMIDDMYGAYEEYEERREQYNRGNYGAEDKEIESVEYMMGCVVDLVKYLNDNAHSQEVKKIIQKHIKKMQEM